MPLEVKVAVGLEPALTEVIVPRVIVGVAPAAPDVPDKPSEPRGIPKFNVNIELSPLI